ncbi:MAG: hypothetical protein R6U95_10025 [Bacteroidales bacterium]
MKQLTVCMFCLCMCVNYGFTQQNGDYRSNQRISKNWKDAGNWDIFTNGQWQNADSPPCKDSIPACITISKHDSIVMDTNNYKLSKLIIEDSAHLTFPYGDVICEDSILIYGTIYNNETKGTKECAKSLYINGGVMYHNAGETFEIEEHVYITNNGTITGTASAKINAPKILLKGSHFPRIDSTNNAVAYNCDTLLVLEDSVTNNIEIAEISCSQFETYGNVNFSGKVGTKTITNFTIHESGHFINSNGESFDIFGDIIIHGEFESGTGTYYLEGTDKSIIGNAEFSQINVTGSYTNYCKQEQPFTVKDLFSGNGTIYQTDNSYIITKCSIEPIIISKETSFIEYTGNKFTSDFILKNDVYNLVLKNHKCTYVLENDITIKSSFRLPDDSVFIDLNGHTLTFSDWSNTDIHFPFSSRHRICLSGGSVIAQNVAPQDTVFFPIAHNRDSTNLARIEICNTSSETHDFQVDSLSHYASKNAQPQGNRYVSGLVNSTYHISSTCKDATIKLFWHAENELPLFENNACNIHHYNGTQWEALHESTIAHDETDNIYSLKATTQSFSPFMIQSDNILLNINLTDFEITQNTDNNTINWSWHATNTSELSSLTLEKSNNGIHFRKIKEFHSTDKKECTYIDNENNYGYYYRLAFLHSDNSITYSKILYAPTETGIKITPINQHLHIQLPKKHHNIHIYTATGTCIAKYNNSRILTTKQLPAGLYIIQILNQNRIIHQEKTHIYYH